MILAAEPAFAFLSNKWNAAVPYFKVLCLGMLSPFSYILNELFIARRKPIFSWEETLRIILVLLIFCFSDTALWVWP